MSLSPRFKRYVDDATGRAYIHDAETGETKWELPDAEWVKLTDKATGRTFWYNQTTRKSQWENPTFRLVETEDQNPSVPAQTADDSRWERFVDQKTGREYLYDPKTQESSWVSPETTKGRSVQFEASSSTKNIQRAISIGVHKETQWEKFWDPNTRRAFFFHRQLGITQWERPSELGTWSPKMKSPPSQDKAESQISAPGSDVVRRDTSSAPSESAHSEVRRKLFHDVPLDDASEHVQHQSSEAKKEESEQQSLNATSKAESPAIEASNASIEASCTESRGDKEIQESVHHVREPHIEASLCGHLFERVELPFHPKAEWRRRFYWLTVDGLLYCGDSPEKRSSIAHLDVKDLMAIREESGDHLEFSLIGSLGTSVTTLRARNENEYQLWLRSLGNIILNTTDDVGDTEPAMQPVDHGERETATEAVRKEAVTQVFPGREKEANLSKVQLPESSRFLLKSKSVHTPEPVIRVETTEELFDVTITSPGKVRTASPAATSSMEAIPTFPMEKGPPIMLTSVQIESTFEATITSPVISPVINQKTAPSESEKREPSPDVTTMSPAFQKALDILGSIRRDGTPSSVVNKGRSVLERIYVQNEDIITKYVKLQVEFRKANFAMHGQKLEVDSIRWTPSAEASARHTVASKGPSANGEDMEESEMVKLYSRLWNVLLKYPEVIASVGACQRTIEARRQFATLIATSFLDPCSVPETECLRQVFLYSTGTAFEIPLSDVVGSYREYRAFGQLLVNAIVEPGVIQTVVEALDTIAETLQTYCPPCVKLFGRAFLNSILIRALSSSLSHTSNHELVGRLIDVLVNRSSAQFEAVINNLFIPSTDTRIVVTNEEEGLVVGKEEWDYLVTSRFELFTLHVALSKFPYSLPEPLEECLRDLGPPRPLPIPQSSHPYLILRHGPRFERQEGSEHPEEDFICVVKACIEQPSVSDEAGNDKTLIQEILALAEKARLETHLLENSIKRICRFSKQFTAEKAALVEGISFEPRFLPVETTEMASPIKSLRTPPSSPLLKPGSKSPSNDTKPGSAATQRSSKGKALESASSDHQKHQESSPPNKSVTSAGGLSPQSTTSTEYASRTRASQRVRQSWSPPSHKPWVCPSNTRSFHS